jgi:hypothetical protein
MNKDHMADKSLSRYIYHMARAEQEGNLGCWCYFDENLFCQEREGCDNCAARWRMRK